MTDPTRPPPAVQPPKRKISPGRYVLFGLIVLLPAALLLWMAMGRTPRPIETLTDGEIARRSTPQQAVAYALPQAVHPVTALTLPDGTRVTSDTNLPLDRDASQIYVFNLLTSLVGLEAQQRFFPVEDFARRLARSSVDLPRHQLPSAFWPVRTTEGRFATVEQDGKTFIAPDNARRYDPLVQLLVATDTARLVSAYVRAYPLLQKAYASLGHNYASYYLNDSVLTAIDELLRTPEPAGPVEVRLPAAGEAHADTVRPWVTYRYADPALEGLSVAQKTLLRMGPAHTRTIKAKLADIRALLVTGSPSAS